MIDLAALQYKRSKLKCTTSECKKWRECSNRNCIAWNPFEKCRFKNIESTELQILNKV